MLVNSTHTIISGTAKFILLSQHQPNTSYSPVQKMTLVVAIISFIVQTYDVLCSY